MRRNRGERSLKAGAKFQGFRFGLFCILVIAFVTLGHSQPPQPQSPDRGGKFGNSYAIGDFETINTTNGNLMLNFPLGSLPAGRGSAAAGIFLTYNSKLYNIRSEKTVKNAAQNEYFYKTLVEKDLTKGGWRVGSMYSLEMEDRRTTYGQYAPQCGYPGDPINDELTYVHKLRVVFPDGSAHEMIPGGHYDKMGDRYFNVDINGLQPSCTGSPTQTNRPVYYSLDGTYTRLETSENGWTLYFPDGSKVVTGTVQQVYDRNGNYVTLSPMGVSDQFGRSVSITTNSGNDIWSITSHGFGGEDVVWTIKWKNVVVSKTYESCTNNASCPQEHWVSDLTEVFQVVDEIERPEELGGSYKFNYNAPDYEYSDPIDPSYGWGEVTEIELPTGAKVKYKYTMDGNEGPVSFQSVRDILKNYPYEKKLEYTTNYDGNSDAVTEKWLYNIIHTGSTVTAPDGGVTITGFGSTEPSSQNPLPWNSGLVLTSFAPDGTKTENLWQRNLPTQCTYAPPPCNSTGWPINNYADNAYIKAAFTSLKNSNGSYSLTAIKEYTYDKNGNITEVKEYDWVPHSTIPRDQEGLVSGLPEDAEDYLKRITRTEFYNPTPEASSSTYNDPDSYIFTSNKRLLQLPKTTAILDKNEVVKSFSSVEYDFINYDSSNTKAGNPVINRVWDSAKGSVSDPLIDNNSVKTQASYNSYGMPLTTTDGNGNVTRVTYPDITIGGQSVTAPYPNQVESAYGTALERTSTSVHDFHTGLITSSTDEDNDVTNAFEYDDLGRPVKSITAVGTPLESWTRTQYDDLERRIIVRSDMETVGDGKKVGIQHFDQLGRVWLTRTLEDATVEDAEVENDGIKVQTRYRYDNPASPGSSNGTYILTSNPYRASTSGTASSEATMGWTLSYSNKTGQSFTEKTFNGSALPSPWGSNSDLSGTAAKEIGTNVVTVTDQAGKKRKSISDGLGRVTQVIEDPTGQDLSTTYIFDENNNLRKTTQGEQTRNFMFSSLGRLLYAKQTEQEANVNFSGSGFVDPVTGNNQWSAKYVYDDNGNITSTVDARNNTITAIYDAHNRLLVRDYSDSAMSDVAVTYDDPNISHSTGIMTNVNNGISENKITSLDILGRTLQSQQVVDGQTYTVGYKYDLSGKVVEETYPSGRVVKNTFDKDGDITQVQSSRSGGGFWAYGSGFEYTATKEIRKFQLGNGHWENVSFNPRSQVTQISLGTVDAGQDILKLEFGYGTNDNNDSLKSQAITISAYGSAPAFSANQAYTYDDLNRIKSVTETSPGKQNWKQTFLYDRFGNRRFDTTGDNTTTLNPLLATKITNPLINSSDNRFQEDQDADSQADYVYDKEGNLTRNAQDMQFLYNAENQQKEVKNENGVTVGLYYYDGNGKRVKKVSGAETIIFVYDENYRLIEEYSTQLSENPQVSYMTNDSLGSPRVVTNEGGAVTNRSDYTAFGEKAPDRDPDLGYENTSNSARGYTGYLEEPESDLYYAQARYYDKLHGRFSSVDPLPSSAVITNPQSLNRYSYSFNTPYRLKDPLGLLPNELFRNDFPVMDGGPCARRRGRCIPGGLTPAKANLEGEKGIDNDATILLPNALLKQLEVDAAYFGSEATKVGRQEGRARSALLGQQNIVRGRSPAGLPDQGESALQIATTQEGLIIVPDELEIESSVSFHNIFGGRVSNKLFPGKAVEAHNTARMKLNDKYDERKALFIKAWLGVVVPVSQSSKGYTTAKLTESYLDNLYDRVVGGAAKSGYKNGFYQRRGPLLGQ